MVKIMLKEPVGGIIQNDVPARSLNYLEASGQVTEELQKSYDEALVEGKSLSFVAPNGRPFLLAARNIAYMLEMPDAQTERVS